MRLQKATRNGSLLLSQELGTTELLRELQKICLDELGRRRRLYVLGHMAIAQMLERERAKQQEKENGKA